MLAYLNATPIYCQRAGISFIHGHCPGSDAALIPPRWGNPLALGRLLGTLAASHRVSRVDLERLDLTTSVWALRTRESPGVLLLDLGYGIESGSQFALHFVFASLRPQLLMIIS